MSVRAAHAWNTNAELIADVAQLYIPADAEVLDLTYGRGVWWRKFRPERLTLMNGEGGFVCGPDGVLDVEPDYRRIPEDWHGRFDVVAFDPPYVSTGGRATSTVPEFNDRYGLTEASRTPVDLHWYNIGGLEQAALAAKPAGLILVKTMPYVSSGKLQPVPMWIYHHADVEMGLTLVDWFVHQGHPGMQPSENLDGSRRRQVHARQNASHLFVFRTPGRKRRTKKGAQS